MKRRWFIPAAVLAAMALALGACGGDDEEGGTAAGDGSITVFSLWGGSEQEAFQKVLDQFTEDTGIETKYESARDFLPVIRTRLAAGNPPDVAIIPRPGVVAELARDDSLIPLEDMGLDPETINENYSDTWTSLATVDDQLYGVVAKANSKSTIWYKPNSFQEAGFEIPATWEDLLQITAQYESQGKTPWAVGAQGRDNSWTLTDWFENIYARTAGPDNYTKLFNGDLPFNDQTVKDALLGDGEDRQRPVRRRRNRHRARHHASSTASAACSARTRSPRCTWRAASSAGSRSATSTKISRSARTSTSSRGRRSARSTAARSSAAETLPSAFVNNEDNKKLIEYLSTPEAGNIWVSTGAIASPNNGVDSADYPNELVAKEADQLKNAESFLFDGSDLLPGTLGQDFGTLLQQIIKSPNNTDSLLDDYQAEAETAFAAN